MDATASTPLLLLFFSYSSFPFLSAATAVSSSALVPSIPPSLHLLYIPRLASLWYWFTSLTSETIDREMLARFPRLCLHILARARLTYTTRALIVDNYCYIRKLLLSGACNFISSIVVLAPGTYLRSPFSMLYVEYQTRSAVPQTIIGSSRYSSSYLRVTQTFIKLLRNIWKVDCTIF